MGFSASSNLYLIFQFRLFRFFDGLGCILTHLQDVLETSWAVLGASWHRLGAMLGRPGAVLASLRPPRPPKKTLELLSKDFYDLNKFDV